MVLASCGSRLRHRQKSSVLLPGVLGNVPSADKVTAVGQTHFLRLNDEGLQSEEHFQPFCQQEQIPLSAPLPAMGTQGHRASPREAPCWCRPKQEMPYSYV